MRGARFSGLGVPVAPRLQPGATDGECRIEVKWTFYYLYVSRHFASLESLGIIRLRESPYYRPELQLTDFVSGLGELFPGGVEAPPG